MATEGSAEAFARQFGRGSAVLAFLTVQVVAFGFAYVSGYPTAYALFALLSAAGAAILGDRGPFGVAAATLGTVLLVAVGLPLLLFVARQNPGLVVEKALDPEVQRALYLSVYGPLLAAVASLAFGVPLAYVLAEGFPGRPLVESLVDLPLVVPHSVAGIVVLFGFGRGGAFPRLTVLGTMVGMVLALVFVSAPFAVNAAREAFEAIDDRLEYAARIHGASRWETFKRVDAPLAARGILTGGVLAWARAVSEFGAVAVVAYSVEFFYPAAGERVAAQHAPIFVYNTFLSSGLDQSGAVALLVLLLAVVIFVLFRWLAYDDSAIGGRLP